MIVGAYEKTKQSFVVEIVVQLAVRVKVCVLVSFEILISFVFDFVRK